MHGSIASHVCITQTEKPAGVCPAQNLQTNGAIRGNVHGLARNIGQRVNEVKARVEHAVDTAQQRLQGGVALAQLASGRVDITLPGIRRPIGAEHPVIKTLNEVVGVFRDLGYSVQEGPVVETDYYNFEALNFPPNHPARDMQDTLFIAKQGSKPARDRLLLRRQELESVAVDARARLEELVRRVRELETRIGKSEKT